MARLSIRSDLEARTSCALPLLGISLDTAGWIVWFGSPEVAAIASQSSFEETPAKTQLKRNYHKENILPVFAAFVMVSWLCLMPLPFTRSLGTLTVPDKLLFSFLFRPENGSTFVFFFITPALLSSGSSESLRWRSSSVRFNFPLSRSWPFSRAASLNSVLASWTDAPTPSLQWKRRCGRELDYKVFLTLVVGACVL